MPFPKASISCPFMEDHKKSKQDIHLYNNKCIIPLTYPIPYMRKVQTKIDLGTWQLWHISRKQNSKIHILLLTNFSPLGKIYSKSDVKVTKGFCNNK